MMKIDSILYGKYQHYRTGKWYQIISIARHSETHEEMIVYKALSQCQTFGDGQI